MTRFDARWLVERDGLTVAVPAGRIRIEDDGDGQQAEVQFPEESRRMTPGYYFALGDVALDPQTEPLLRIYWHLAADRAVSFLDAATRIRNGDGLPFRLKILYARAAYRRCDSAIL